MKKQRGLSLSGLLLWSFILIIGLLLGFKLFPHYLEFWTIQKAVRELAVSPELKDGNPKAVQAAFARRGMVENIKAVKPDEVETTKDGNQIVISAAWSVKVPLFHNVSVWIDFEAKSDK